MNTHNCLIKHINRGWAFTLVLVFYSLLSFSQSTETLSSIAQSLADIYDLEGDNVPTGYLSDRAVDLVGLHKYDGQSLCDSNYVSPVIFRDLLRTINYSRVKSSVTQYNPDDTFTTLTSSSSGVIKLAAAVFQYNTIASDAITNNKINYNQTTGVVSDKYINNIWQNPYTQKRVCMFTVGSHSCTETAVTYDLSYLLSFGNCNLSLIEIDFGDGSGFTSISNLSNRYISYTNGEGTKELKLRITLSDNTILNSHTFIVIGDDYGEPQTKTVTEEPEFELSSVRHYFQTNHRIILMHHVVLVDSVYVQTLTEADMSALQITDAERQFSNDYIIQLNELLRNK